MDFVEFLEEKKAKPPPCQSLYEILADSDVKITEEEIAEAGREM